MIRLYNETKHNGINGIKPNEATEKENLLTISTLNFDKQIMNNEKIQAKTNKLFIGDKVRLKIEKGTFAKGYEITYSKEVYVIASIKGKSILLDNGDTVSINDIQKVFEGATEVQMNKKDKAEKVAVVKRKMAKEGMESVLDGKYYK
jgi:hypothetical protein